MLSAKLLAVSQPMRRRATRRSPMSLSVVRLAPAWPSALTITNLSCTGIRFESDEDFAVGQRLRLHIPGAGVRTVTIVRCDDGYGCVFERRLTTHEMHSADGTQAVAPFAAGAIRQVAIEPRAARYPGCVRAALLAGGTMLGWLIVFALVIGLGR